MDDLETTMTPDRIAEIRAAKREPRWKHLLAPHSYDPRDGATRVRWFWRLDVHLPAAYWRARYWWWKKRGY